MPASSSPFMPPMNSWSEKPVNVHITVVGISGMQKRSITLPSSKLKAPALRYRLSPAAKKRKTDELRSERIVESMKPRTPIPIWLMNMMLKTSSRSVVSMPSNEKSRTSSLALTNCEHCALTDDVKI